jgi:hypothetical protein
MAVKQRLCRTIANDAYTYRLNVDARKLFDKLRHSLKRVVDAFQKHRLVAHNHPMLEQVVRSLSCDPCDFVRMVDVSMETNLLSQVPAVLRESNQGLGPRITFLDPTWGDSETLGCESDSLDMFHSEQSTIVSYCRLEVVIRSLPFPYLEEILWLQKICVTTRHHNVFQIFVTLDILEYRFPTFAAWLLWFLRDCFSTSTDCVGSSAEPTVDWR